MALIKNKKTKRNLLIGVAIGILFLIAINQNQQTQAAWTPQATCDEYNGPLTQWGIQDFGLWSEQRMRDCRQAGCYVRVHANPGLLIPGFMTGYSSICSSFVETGLYTPDGAVACEEKTADELNVEERAAHCGNFFNRCYICQEEGQGTTVYTDCSGTWSEPIASLFQAVVPNPTINCEMQAGLVIGAGVLLFMAFL